MERHERACSAEVGIDESEYKACWEDLMDRNRGFNTYTSAAALLLCWSEELDGVATRKEVAELSEVFKKRLNIDTQVECLDTKSKLPLQPQLNAKLASFAYNFDRPKSLLIVYYAGRFDHGSNYGNSGSFGFVSLQMSAQQGDKTTVDRQIWNRIEMLLQPTQADVFLILNCDHPSSLGLPEDNQSHHCSSPSPSAYDQRKFECLVARTQSQLTPAPMGTSFTSTFIWALRSLIDQKPKGFFTTWDLLQKIKDHDLAIPDKWSPELLDRGNLGAVGQITLHRLLEAVSEDTLRVYQDLEINLPLDNPEDQIDLTLIFRFENTPTIATIRSLGEELKRAFIRSSYGIDEVRWGGFQKHFANHTNAMLWPSLGKNRENEVNRDQAQRISPLQIPSSALGTLPGGPSSPAADESEKWFQSENDDSHQEPLAIREKIVEAISINPSFTKNPQTDILNMTYVCSWEILDVLEGDGRQYQSLSEIVTLTGTLEYAQVETCEKHIFQTWPKAGPFLLEAIGDAFNRIYRTPFEYGKLSRTPAEGSVIGFREFQLSVEAQSSTPGKVNRLSRIRIEGSMEIQIEVAEILAWLTAAIRTSESKELRLSKARFIFVHNSADLRNLEFEIDPKPLEDPRHTTVCFRHRELVNGAVAVQFPVQERLQALANAPEVRMPESQRELSGSHWKIAPTPARDTVNIFTPQVISPFCMSPSTGGVSGMPVNMAGGGHPRVYFTNELFAVTAFHHSAKLSAKHRNGILREISALRAREHSHIRPLVASFITSDESRGENFCLWMQRPVVVDMEKWSKSNDVPAHPPLLLGQQSTLKSFLYDSILSLVSGLSYIHSDQGGFRMGHFDIRPANILLFEEDGRWVWKLSGFRHARLVSNNYPVETVEPLKTLKYQAPEYNTNIDDGRLDIPCDVFSMGCIIIELATLIRSGGWKHNQVQVFEDCRRANTAPEIKQDDDSFRHHMRTVKEWVDLLKINAQSKELEYILETANSMIRTDPRKRVMIFDAVLDIWACTHLEKGVADFQAECNEVLEGHGPSNRRTKTIYNPLHTTRAMRLFGHTHAKVRTDSLRAVGWQDSV